MGRFRLNIGSVLGVRISLHASWFVVLGLVVWVTATEFDDLYPRLPVAEHVGMAAVTGIVFFVCLLLHELAHAVLARRLGVRVVGITLFAFGGMAQIAGEMRDPGDEFAVALVGPTTSIVLGGLFGLAGIAAARAGLPAPAGVASTLSLVNLGVAVFNLIPGLPLDGGRLLRAALWRVLHDHARATRAAAFGGYLVAAALAVLGVLLIATGEYLGAWYVLIGVFLAAMTRGSTRSSARARGVALASRGEVEPPSDR